jgi:hypothetical protein
MVALIVLPNVEYRGFLRQNRLLVGPIAARPRWSLYNQPKGTAAEFDRWRVTITYRH